MNINIKGQALIMREAQMCSPVAGIAEEDNTDQDNNNDSRKVIIPA